MISSTLQLGKNYLPSHPAFPESATTWLGLGLGGVSSTASILGPFFLATLESPSHKLWPTAF